MNGKKIADMRKDYGIRALDLESVDPNPLKQFELWFLEAYKSEGEEANAFTLATIGLDGFPGARIVLLKLYAEDGFSFFTNYNSLKAKELDAHPVASMTFHWRSLERQVRIRGSVSKLDPILSDEYYSSRPRESQIGAWASPQSERISGRDQLNEKYEFYAEKFEGNNHIPRPPYWGGYQLKPNRIEFWQGRPNRLHDRILFELKNDQWVTSRMAP